MENSTTTNTNSVSDTESLQALIAEVQQNDEASSAEHEELIALITNFFKIHRVRHITGKTQANWITFRQSEGEHDYHCKAWYSWDDRTLLNTIYNETGVKVAPLLKKHGITLVDIAIETGNFYNEQTITYRPDLHPSIYNKLDDYRAHWLIGSPELAATPASAELPKPLAILLRSLSDSKLENLAHFAHLTQWQQIADSTTTIPAVNLFGAEGTGKNILFEYMIPTLYHGDRAVCEMKPERLNGFNAQMEGAVLVIMNETKKGAGGSYDEAIKSVLASRKITIEQKGKDSYTVDNIASYMFFTNDPLGSVNLSQSDNSNRRFSIMKAETPLVNCVIESGEATNTTQARAYIRDYVIPACTSRTELSKMFRWMQRVFPCTACPSPLHGEDFKALQASQRSDSESAIKSIIDVIENDKRRNMISQKDLIDCIKTFLTNSTDKALNDNHVKRLILTSKSKLDQSMLNSNIRVAGAAYPTKNWLFIGEYKSKPAQRVPWQREELLDLVSQISEGKGHSSISDDVDDYQKPPRVSVDDIMSLPSAHGDEPQQLDLFADVEQEPVSVPANVEQVQTEPVPEQVDELEALLSDAGSTQSASNDDQYFEMTPALKASIERYRQPETRRTYNVDQEIAKTINF